MTDDPEDPLHRMRRIQFAPPSEINRELEAIAHRLRTQPGRISRARTSVRELHCALYLRAFCNWDWAGARNYAAFLTDYRRTHHKP